MYAAFVVAGLGFGYEQLHGRVEIQPSVVSAVCFYLVAPSGSYSDAVHFEGQRDYMTSVPAYTVCGSAVDGHFERSG